MHIAMLFAFITIRPVTFQQQIAPWISKSEMNMSCVMYSNQPAVYEQMTSRIHRLTVSCCFVYCVLGVYLFIT